MKQKVDLESIKQKITEKKKILLLKEKSIKTLEKKRYFKRWTELGQLAFETKLSELDDLALLGALLEIAEQCKNQHVVAAWVAKGQEYKKPKNVDTTKPIAIKFVNVPSEEIKKQLKILKLTWSSFRKEYYGYANIENVKSVLHGTSYTLDIL